MHGLWLSALFGAVLLSYSGRRRAPKREPAAVLARAAAGGLVGTLVFVACHAAMWLFSWMEQPSQWEVLVLAVLVQAGGLWYLSWLLRDRDYDARPVPPASPADLARIRARLLASERAAESTTRQILHSLAALAFLGAVFMATFWTVAPPYRQKMVLMLWLLPVLGVATIGDGVRGIRKGLARHEVLLRSGLGAILLLASYTGLRLHYGQPILPH